MPIALKEQIYSVKFHSMPGVIFVVSMNHLNGFYKVPKVPIFTRNRFKIRQERSPCKYSVYLAVRYAPGKELFYIHLKSHTDEL